MTRHKPKSVRRALREAHAKKLVTERLAAVALDCYKDGTILVRSERCRGCAFKPGSPERCDPFEWAKMTEFLTGPEGVFLCHEGLPAHPWRVEGQLPHVCAGFHEMKPKPIKDWLALAHHDGRETPTEFYPPHLRGKA